MTLNPKFQNKEIKKGLYIKPTKKANDYATFLPTGYCVC